MRIFLLSLVVVLLAPALAEANDAEYGNISGTPAPIKNDAIEMTSEDITIEELETGLWRVHASYKFTNSTDAPEKLQMGFPEQFGDDSKEFLKFKTTVRGATVAVNTAKSGPIADASGIKASLGRVHLFDVEFAPKEAVVVEHDYTMEGGGSVAFVIEQTVSYVTRTGALWKGPIGRATFTVRTRKVHDLLAWPTEFKFKSMKHYVVQKGEITGTELVLENTNWMPKGDLDLNLMFDEGGLRRAAVGAECPDLDVDFRKFQAAPRDEKEQHVTVGDLSKFDTATLRLCRNHRYARYGYKFSDEKLNKRFYGEMKVGTYPPGAERIEDFEGTQMMLRPWMIDPNFTPAMLTIQDLAYIKLLRAEERRRREVAKTKTNP